MPAVTTLLALALALAALPGAAHALSTDRTTSCLLDNEVVSFTATHPAFGAVPDDGRDDHDGISAAVEAAHDMARSLGESCHVEVYLAPGRFDTTATIIVPSRVSLVGAGVNDTSIRYVGEYHAIELRALDPADRCDTVRHARVRDLGITMNGGAGSDPDRGGHCIASGRGVTDAELVSLNLDGCDGYGIGFQQRDSCPAGAAYERLTLNRVRIANTGSDGIDFKGGPNVNRDIDLHDLCVLDIARRPGGRWASALDLAGDDFWIDRFTFISSAPSVNGTNTNGIDVNGGRRTVRDSIIGEFDIVRATHAVVFTPDDASRNITFTKGGRVEDSIKGILLSGSGHRSAGPLCVVGSSSGTRLSSGGNDVRLSDECPESAFFAAPNPVCAYGLAE